MTSPCCIVPEMLGGLVFDGEAGAGVTVAVGAEAAAADPSEFDAVTRTRNVPPTSAVTAV
jgi:hypothetical protein